MALQRAFTTSRIGPAPVPVPLLELGAHRWGLQIPLGSNQASRGEAGRLSPAPAVALDRPTDTTNFGLGVNPD